MSGTTGRPGRRWRGKMAAALVLAAGLPVSAQLQDQPVKESEQLTQLRQKLEAARNAGDDGSVAQIESMIRAELERSGAPGALKAPAGAPQPARAGNQAGGRPGTATPGGRAAPGQPGATGPTRPGIRVVPTGPSGELPVPGPDEVVLSAFSDGLDLKALVEYVAETLQVNIIGNDTLTGTVVLNGPMVIKRNQLLTFLDSLLSDQGFMLASDGQLPGFYKVLPISSPTYNFGGDLPTTRVIHTPTIKPSTLAPAINDQVQSQALTMRITYLDELGMIILTDSARRIDAVSDLVERIIDRTRNQQFLRMELDYVAAGVARQRVLEMMGVQQPTLPGIQQPGQPQVINANAGGQLLTAPITNLSDRLTVDPAGNALIFRGYPEEASRIEEVLKVIDRPNKLKYEQYYAGRGAQQIAELAERLGLGHVEVIESLPSSGTATNAGFTQQPQQGNRNQQFLQALQQQQQQTALSGGPVMIVDTSRNLIIYYGTELQQQQLKSLIDKFDTDLEQVTIETYKIKNQYAADIADVVSGIVTGQTGSDTSNPFLPGGNPFGAFQRGNQGQGNQGNTRTNRSSGRSSSSNIGSTTSSRSAATRSQSTIQPGGGNIRPVFVGAPGQGNRAPQPGAVGAGGLGGEDVFIMADAANNVVIVKAPKGQQEEFARLIARLDQRRPQVQIEVQIVSVTATDDFRLAVEAQGIIGQFATNTNFGLGSLTGGTAAAPTGGFTSRKSVATNLPGITAAFIKSNQVPLIVTALKNDFDSRILSSPQITVDDNVEATIESTDLEPTSTTNIGTSTTSETFSGYEEAGTVVTVVPSISEGGYMRLSYDIELSNFVGAGSAGFPPPKQVRHVTSESVTIPGDTTIIVGGIKVDTKSSNISKVPLLGDIPLIGHLFRDTNKSNSSTRLYIFITPRILRDDNFRDLLLLTEGPLRDAELRADVPPLEPVMMELAGRGRVRASVPPPTAEPRPADPSLTRPAPPAPGAQPSTEGF